MSVTSTLSDTRINGLLKIGQAEDPVTECKRQAPMGAERQAELRSREERKKHPGIFEKQPEHGRRPGKGAAPERKKDEEQRDRERLERFARERDIGLVREALAIFDGNHKKVRKVAAGDIPKPHAPNRHIEHRPAAEKDESPTAKREEVSDSLEALLA